MGIQSSGGERGTGQPPIVLRNAVSLAAGRRIRRGSVICVPTARISDKRRSSGAAKAPALAYAWPGGYATGTASGEARRAPGKKKPSMRLEATISTAYRFTCT